MAKTSSSGGGAPNQRQLRLGELIRRRLSELLQRGEIHDPDLSRMMITVGEVRCSSDLSVATAFVLPLGGDNKEEALLALRKSRHEIRREVAKVLNIKYAPEIRFEIDDTFDRMDATRALFERDDVKADLAAPDGPDADGADATAARAGDDDA
ncbi:30S ribosome-binding factor RbfA [Loktanella atrilutea]|nr:30S ribosome-binding factor RbfA [Loktanella atrilutea]